MMKLISIKHFFVALAVLIISGSFMSCKKCHTCIAKDQDGVIRYTYPQVCGSKKNLSTYADRCKEEYGAFDYTCQCGEDL